MQTTLFAVFLSGLTFVAVKLGQNYRKLAALLATIRTVKLIKTGKKKFVNRREKLGPLY